MTIRGFRQGRIAHLAAVVTAALLAAGTPAAWAGPAASARPATALEVQSEPAGAAVYVDGTLKGATPLAVEGILVGDHTVRVVKDGFLENSRTVAVPASGRALRVALTPTRTPARAMMQVEPEQPGESGGGGGSKKWLFIGLGAVALTGAGVGVYLATKKEAPKISSVTANPTTALQGATAVTFTAAATGDSLTYSWDFGDGLTGSGASTTHVYQSAGTFNVSVEVSNGDKSATGTTTVTAKGMAGRWGGVASATGYRPLAFNVNLAQTGASISGSYSDNGVGSGTASGEVQGPLTVRFTARVPGFQPFTFTGVLSADLNSASGTVAGLKAPAAFTMTRQ